MAQVLVTDTYLTNIANAIRTMTSTTATYTPAQMAPAISNIPFINYYTGASIPANSLGNNGDLYFQTTQ